MRRKRRKHPPGAQPRVEPPNLPRLSRPAAEISLLDYSGFRYDADLKTNPVRWTDMQDAAGFAAKQWQSISERVTDAGLKQRVSDALHEMETAASDKSAVNAHAAANAELDLVDTLEVWFNRGKA